jgi:hypothetical protein
LAAVLYLFDTGEIPMKAVPETEKRIPDTKILLFIGMMRYFYERPS